MPLARKCITLNFVRIKRELTGIRRKVYLSSNNLFLYTCIMKFKPLLQGQLFYSEVFADLKLIVKAKLYPPG